TGASTAAGAAGSAGSAGSSVASTASTGLLGTVSSVVGIVTGIVSAGAAVYGDAVMVNIKDTLNGMHNDTTALAKAVADPGSMKDALLALKNDFSAFSTGAFSGWYKDQLTNISDDIAGIKTDIESWLYTDLAAIGGRLDNILSPGLSDIVSAIGAQKPNVTVNVQVDGSMMGTVRELTDTISLQLSQQLALHQ
ncbi:MAG: hypothetical protein ABI824_19210, partial [Acidobacteriota bacterium]